MIKADQPTIFGTKIKATISSKEDGNMLAKYSSLEDTARNIGKMLPKIGATPNKTIILNVSDHEEWDGICDVGQADLASPLQRIMADALVTNQKDLALVLPTADCNPVILYDPQNQVLALAHLGWQSTVADLAFKTIHHLKNKYDSRPSEVLVYFGPAIKAESYIFDGPLSQETDIAWQPFMQKTDKGIGIDLLGFNIQCLQEAGILAKNIEASQIDTAASSNYFSHYRASRSGGKEAEGRFATFCKLTDIS